MHLTLRPGIDRNTLLTTLRQISDKISNLYTSGPFTPLDRLRSYLEWADETAGLLAPLIGANDIDTLVFTRRYDRVFSKLEVLAAPDLTRLANNLLNIELRERTDAFASASKAFAEAISGRAQSHMNVAFDTTVFIKDPAKLEEIDFRALTGVYEGSVNLIIPMVVVDELDKLKESKTPHARWRAGYSLAVLERLFPRGGMPFAILHNYDASKTSNGSLPHPEVTVEIVFDPPGHVRLPIDDDEIVDRLVTVQPLAGPVKLYTYDTSQAMRARQAGLNVQKLSLPAEPEPESKAKT